MEQDKIILLAKICQLKDMQIFLLKQEETLKKELEKLELAKSKEVGIKYVYIGNVPGHEGNSTYCPRCEKRLVRRIHFSILDNRIKNGKCSFCGEDIPGLW